MLRFHLDRYTIDPTDAMLTGIHALFTAALGIRTHAFEPLARNLEKLECSAANNAVIGKHLVINGFGLSDKASDGGCLVRECESGIVSAFVTVFRTFRLWTQTTKATPCCSHSQATAHSHRSNCGHWMHTGSRYESMIE